MRTFLLIKTFFRPYRKEFVITAEKDQTFCITWRLSAVLWSVWNFWNFATFTGKHLRQRTLLKKTISGTGFFTWILRNFLESLFLRTPPVAASDSSLLVYWSFNVTTHATCVNNAANPRIKALTQQINTYTMSTVEH